MGIHPGCDHIGFESKQGDKVVCLRCGDEIVEVIDKETIPQPVAPLELEKRVELRHRKKHG